MSQKNPQENNEVNEKDLTDALDAAIEKEGSSDPLDLPLNEDLQREIKELKEQIEDEKLRSVANVQNLIRRHQDELQAAHKFAMQSFAADMVLIKDYLEMALLDQSGNFEAIKMGVDMTLKQLISTFEKNKIVEINPLGEMLDPNKHQAMNTEESDKPANTVLRVMQKGYELNGRILRPAMVIVAKAPSEETPESEK